MPTRIVVAGCRDYNNYIEAKEYIDSCIAKLNIQGEIIIISGGARGADKLGEQYAKEKGYKTEYYLPDWESYGRSAGPIRNAEMAKAGDVIICFWDGVSRGTKSMINSAKKHEKIVMVKTITV